MAAAQRAQHRRAEAAAQAVGPEAGGVDDAARPHVAGEARTLDARADDRARLHAGVARLGQRRQRHVDIARAQQRLHGRAVVDARPVPLRLLQHAHHQARVVGLRIEIAGRAEQLVGRHVRREHAHLRGRVERARALVRHRVVDRQPGGERAPARRAAVVVAEKKALRLDQARRVLQQAAALAHRFAREAERAFAQVAQSAVDQLGGARRAAPGEVARLDQHHGNAAARRLQRHAGAGDAAADHEQVDIGHRRARANARPRRALTPRPPAGCRAPSRRADRTRAPSRRWPTCRSRPSRPPASARDPCRRRAGA